MSIGALALVARSFGGRDLDSAHTAGRQAMLTAVGASFISVFVLIFLADPILRLVGGSDELVAMAAPYLALSAVSAPLPDRGRHGRRRPARRRRHPHPHARLGADGPGRPCRRHGAGHRRLRPAGHRRRHGRRPPGHRPLHAGHHLPLTPPCRGLRLLPARLGDAAPPAQGLRPGRGRDVRFGRRHHGLQHHRPAAGHRLLRRPERRRPNHVLGLHAIAGPGRRRLHRRGHKAWERETRNWPTATGARRPLPGPWSPRWWAWSCSCFRAR